MTGGAQLLACLHAGRPGFELSTAWKLAEWCMNEPVPGRWRKLGQKLMAVIAPVVQGDPGFLSPYFKNEVGDDTEVL